MFNKGTERAVIPSVPRPYGKGCIMVIYSDLFIFIIMLCAIITLVRNDKHKK